MSNQFQVDRVYRSEDGTVFFTQVQDFVPTVPAGIYNIGSCQTGYYFKPFGAQHTPVITDPDQEALVSEINTFWKSGDKYREFGFQHKRGVVLHGPPGTGKSTLLRLISDKVVAMGGLCIFMVSDTDDFNQCMLRYRQTSPNTPVMFMLEDLDRWQASSSFLNCLDGLQPLDHVLFVATTNHLENVTPALLRPSRFDRKIEVGMPSERTRRRYIEVVVGNKVTPAKIDELVQASDGRSIADIKEVLLQMLVYDVSAEKLPARNTIEEIRDGAPDDGRPIRFIDCAKASAPLARTIAFAAARG